MDAYSNSVTPCAESTRSRSRSETADSETICSCASWSPGM